MVDLAMDDGVSTTNEVNAEITRIAALARPELHRLMDEARKSGVMSGHLDAQLENKAVRATAALVVQMRGLPYPHLVACIAAGVTMELVRNEELGITPPHEALSRSIQARLVDMNAHLTHVGGGPTWFGKHAGSLAEIAAHLALQCAQYGALGGLLVLCAVSLAPEFDPRWSR